VLLLIKQNSGSKEYTEKCVLANLFGFHPAPYHVMSTNRIHAHAQARLMSAVELSDPPVLEEAAEASDR
jgi:hypothetical protein